jgi:hypothetical protein
MNFIAHYYLEDKNSSTYYNLGLVMPDLVRIFLRGKHIFPTRMEDSIFTAEQLQINEGSKTHMEQDKVFHNSKYFHHMMGFSKEAFHKNGVSGLIPKYWFLAHIALELILDRYLIIEFDGIVEEFYTAIEDADEKEIRGFLEIHKVEKIDLFIEKWQKFLEYRYLYKYTENDQLVFALNKIYQRAGMEGDWTVEQKRTVEKCIQDIEHETSNNMDLLKKELSLPIV